MRDREYMFNCSICLNRSSCRLLLAYTFILSLSGCATDAALTESQGALLGAAVGGVIGKIVGEEKGAIAGIFFGSIIGSKWGVHVASKKESYANQEAYLKDVIAAAETVTLDTQEFNKTISQRIDQLKQRQRELKVAASEHIEQQESLKKHESELAMALEITNTNILRVAHEIEIQKRVIAAEQSTARLQLVNVASAGVSELEIQERALRRALAQLKSIDERRIY